jgi:Holliday junction resolvase
MESPLQKKIIKDLKKRGWIPLKVVLCNMPGFNDIIAFKAKKAFFLEVKDKGKTAEPLQIYRHDLLIKEGFQVFVIDTWEQYLQIKYANL